MKTRILSIIAIVATVVMFTACSSKNDYLEALPSTPIAMVKLNINDLLNKSEILQDNQIKGLAKEGINSLPNEIRSVLRQILEEPETSGIELTQPCYVVLENLEHYRGMILLAVKDEAALKNLMETILEEMNLSFTLSEKNGYNTLKDNSGNVYATFDSSKFVIAFAKNNADATEYMEANNKSKESNKDINEFIETNADIATYYDYAQVMRLAGMINPMLSGSNMTEFENTYFISSCNFENGKIVSGGKVIGMDAYVDKSKEVFSTPNGNLLKYLPKNSYGVFQCNINNWAQFIELLPEATKNMYDNILESLNQQIAQNNSDIKLDYSLLNSVDGDMVVAITPYLPEQGQKEPQFILIAECKDSKLFNAIVALSKEAIEVSKNLYALNMNKRIDWSNYTWGSGEYKYIREGYDYYLGFDDNKIFLIPENFCKEKLVEQSVSFEDNKLASELKKTWGMVFDINYILSDIESKSKNINNNDRIVLSFIKYFKDAIISINNDYRSGDFILNFTDKENNALKQIKDMVMSFTVAVGSR